MLAKSKAPELLFQVYRKQSVQIHTLQGNFRVLASKIKLQHKWGTAIQKLTITTIKKFLLN